MDLRICNKKEVVDVKDDVSIPLVRGNKSKELPKIMNF